MFCSTPRVKSIRLNQSAGDERSTDSAEGSTSGNFKAKCQGLLSLLEAHQTAQRRLEMSYETAKAVGIYSIRVYLRQVRRTLGRVHVQPQAAHMTRCHHHHVVMTVDCACVRYLLECLDGRGCIALVAQWLRDCAANQEVLPSWNLAASAMHPLPQPLSH